MQPDLVYMTQEDVVGYARDRYWQGFWTGLVVGLAIGAGLRVSLKDFRS